MVAAAGPYRGIAGLRSRPITDANTVQAFCGGDGFLGFCPMDLRRVRAGVELLLVMATAPLKQCHLARPTVRAVSHFYTRPHRRPRVYNGCEQAWVVWAIIGKRGSLRPSFLPRRVTCYTPRDFRCGLGTDQGSPTGATRRPRPDHQRQPFVDRCSSLDRLHRTYKTKTWNG